MSCVDVRRVCFDSCKACRMHVEVRRVELHYNKASRRQVEVREVCFDCSKACSTPVELRRAGFDYRKRARSL